MVRLLSFLLVLVLSRPALARERLGPAVHPAPKPLAVLQGDSRLEQKVTLRLPKRSLAWIAAELSRLTGARITTRSEVADEPALVYVTDRPAREVMQHLAMLFDYRWARSEKAGALAYELYQTAQAKREEETLRGREREEALQRLMARVRRAIESGLRPDRSEWKGLSWPLLHVAALVRPEQWQALVDGEVLYFSTGGEPGTVGLPEAVARELRDARPSLERSRYLDPQPSDEGRARRLQLEARMQAEWASAPSVRVAIALRHSSDSSEGAEDYFSLSIVPTPAGVRGEDGDPWRRVPDDYYTSSYP